MQRRTFNAALAAFAGGALGGLPGLVAGANREDDWSTAFSRGLADAPWLAGYQSVSAPALDARAKLTGRWPAELGGTLYRNGPAQHELGGHRYHHWFDGDGMLQAFFINDGTVRHRARMIETYKYQAEREAGRHLYDGFGTVLPEGRRATSPDSVNVANISVLPHGGQLLALWEAGSPWRIEPESLETLGRQAYSTETTGVPFSAHPRVEPDGTLWNFGYLSNAGLIVLWHIDPQGTLKRTGTVKVDPISMPHDFIVTERHLVLLLPPFNFVGGGAGNFLDAHQWQPDQATRVLVIDKNDFSKQQWLDLPAQWVFHFGNGFEDEGIIHFDAARADDPRIMTQDLRNVMRGQDGPRPRAAHYHYRLDLKAGTASEEAMVPDLETEFPSVDPRVSARRHNRVLVLGRRPDSRSVHHDLDEVCLLDLDNGLRGAYRYPDHELPEEHLLVPKPGSAPEQDAWVMGTCLDWKAGRTRLNLFDAQRLADGPIATASLPYALPLGLHGKFVAR